MNVAIKYYTLTRWDALKIIALLLMFIDHAGYFYFHDELWMRAVGRSCAPIFFFLSGFAPHYRFNMRLMLLAIVLTAFDWGMQHHLNTLNILFTIILGRIILGWLERHHPAPLKLHEWVIGCIIMITSMIVVQYGSLGFLFMLAGFVYKHKEKYSPQTPSRLLMLATLIYGVVSCVLGSYDTNRWVITAIFLASTNALIRWFALKPRATLPCSDLTARLLLPFSRYTAEIYVAHIVVLILLTGQKL